MGKPRKQHRECRCDDEQAATVRAGATRADEDQQEQPDAHGPGNAGRSSSSQRRREQQRLDLIRDAEEPSAAVRMRPDRGERVDVRPRHEDNEERGEKCHDGRDEQRLPEAKEQRAAARDDAEGDDDRRRVVHAHRAEHEGSAERDRRDEHGCPPCER